MIDENETPAERRWGEISESADPAEYMAWKVLRELRGRKGFRQLFDDIDDETQVEIIDKIVAIIGGDL